MKYILTTFLAVFALCTQCLAQIAPEEVPSEFSNEVIQIEGTISSTTAKQIGFTTDKVNGKQLTITFEIANIVIPKALSSDRCVFKGVAHKYRLTYSATSPEQMPQHAPGEFWTFEVTEVISPKEITITKQPNDYLARRESRMKKIRREGPNKRLEATGETPAPQP